MDVDVDVDERPLTQKQQEENKLEELMAPLNVSKAAG